MKGGLQELKHPYVTLLMLSLPHSLIFQLQTWIVPVSLSLSFTLSFSLSALSHPFCLSLSSRFISFSTSLTFFVISLTLYFFLSISFSLPSPWHGWLGQCTLMSPAQPGVDANLPVPGRGCQAGGGWERLDT